MNNYSLLGTNAASQPLSYGHRKIGVPRRTGACKRALFVHAYERAELATAAVIHILHFHVIHHLLIPLMSRADAAGLIAFRLVQMRAVSYCYSETQTLGIPSFL